MDGDERQQSQQQQQQMLPQGEGQRSLALQQHGGRHPQQPCSDDSSPLPKIVAVDLQPMAPIEGVIQLQVGHSCGSWLRPAPAPAPPPPKHTHTHIHTQREREGEKQSAVRPIPCRIIYTGRYHQRGDGTGGDRPLPGAPCRPYRVRRRA